MIRIKRGDDDLADIAVRDGIAGAWFDAPTHDTAYAQQLYANLRALDALAADEIWIEAPPDGPEWHAVRDRLRRATHGN